MGIIERDPILRTFVNENPGRLSDFIIQSKWPSVDWVTYSFANRKFYDPITTSKKDDAWVLHRFMHYYQRLARQTKKAVYPLCWISHEDKTLHFHCIELSEGVEDAERYKAFHLHFKKYGQLPKDLAKSSIIHSQPFDPNAGAIWYASGGHNRIKSIIHKPHKKGELPLHLMGELDIELEGHAKLLMQKVRQTSVSTKPAQEDNPFTLELVRLLSSF